jgi:hypothetical protein
MQTHGDPKNLPHLEAVVNVLDFALCEADVTENGLVKDHSLKDNWILLKHSTLHLPCQTLEMSQFTGYVTAIRM